MTQQRKISELTEVTTLNDDDELVFVHYEGGNLGPEPTPTPTPTPTPSPTPTPTPIPTPTPTPKPVPMVLSFELTGEEFSADYQGGGVGFVPGCHKNDGKYIYSEVDTGNSSISYRYTHEDDLNKSSNVRYFYHTNNQEWKFTGYGYCAYDNFLHSNNIWSRDLIREKLNPCTSPMINTSRTEESFGGGKISNCVVGLYED